MSNKLIATAIIALILTSAVIVFAQGTNFVSATGPSKLNIIVGPSSVLADNNVYNCIFVQLQDSSGQPARANQDTVITLSSSLTNIGTVSPSVTIPKGSTYAIASFSSTFAPGTSTISASATGYSTVQSSITTIGPIPSAIAVYGLPSILPSDGGTYNAILVQLQDSSGYPARAPHGGVQVSLSCQDTSVGAVAPSITIPEGQTYAIANFTTNPQSTLQSTTISILSQGYSSRNTLTISTTPLATNPSQIKIFAGPTYVPADQNSYKVAVALENASGYIAFAPLDINITMASSDQTVGNVNSQVTIPLSQAYTLATFSSTYKAGSTTLAAQATNLAPIQQLISTYGFTPTKLAVFCVPATLPSDNATYQAIQVQLQDSLGRPAKDPTGAVSVSLFSSQPTVGGVSSALTIPFGSTQASGTFTVTNAPGTTTVTAQASGYSTAQAQMTTYLIDFSPLQITLTANPQNVSNGNPVNITAYVTADGNPITGATLTFTSSNGGTFASTTELGSGYYNTTFTAPNFSTTNCTVTASASKTGYLSSQSTTQITVAPGATVTPTPTPTQTPSATPNETNTAQLQFRIVDSEGNPLSDVLVSSIVQPEGTLIDTTNATGYVTFENVTAGLYTFKLVKDGFPTQNETLDYNPKLPTITITLSSSSSGSGGSGSSLIIIVSIIIAAVVVAAVGGLYFMRRKKSPNVNKLKDLQKQMKNY